NAGPGDRAHPPARGPRVHAVRGRVLRPGHARAGALVRGAGDAGVPVGYACGVSTPYARAPRADCWVERLPRRPCPATAFALGCAADRELQNHMDARASPA